jgi:hypothetical protein
MREREEEIRIFLVKREKKEKKRRKRKKREKESYRIRARSWSPKRDLS